MQPNPKEQAIHFFEQSFETFYEHTMAIDADCRITWISDAYARFLGLTGSPIGKPVTDIVPNSFMPGVVKSGEPVFLDMLHVNSQWVVVSAFPLTDSSGTITGAFGFVAVDQMKRIQPLLEKYSSLQAKLRRAEAELSKSRRARYTLSQCIGISPAIRQVKKLIKQAANFDLAVMLLGETGTGKELFAHALHNLSYRSDKPFVSINVAAVPENLLEAEFFGVSPGAYTGATVRVGLVSSSWPMAVPCSWMRSATCLSRSRPSCCVYCRKKRWSELAPIPWSRWMCVSLPPPARISTAW